MRSIYTLLFLAIFSYSLNLQAQNTISTCSNDTIKLKADNHQYGTLEWQKSIDGIKWENIHNAHDSIYVFTTTKAAYYRVVNKFPNCEPIISLTTLVQRPPIANAGQDRLINDSFLFLSGNSALASTGTWSVIEGTGGTILEPNNPNSKFTGTTGNYKLLWSLQNDCGVSQDTLNVKFINNQYHNKIVIVDETDNVLSTPTEIANGNYNIQFSTPIPVIDNETILIGTVGNGFLRKVNSVTQNGNTFTMSTSQGKLKDIFVEGGFELGNVFEIDSILPASRMAQYKRLNHIPTRAQILSNPNLQTGVHYFLVDESITSQDNSVQMSRSLNTNSTFNTNNTNPSFSFTFNNTLVNQGGFNIKLEGGLTFTPNVYADFETGLFNTKFNVGLNNATLVNDYKFILQHTTSNNLINQDFNLFNYDRLVYFLVGGVPVLVNVNVQFDGNATAEVATDLSFTHEYVNTITTNAGISLNNGNWSYNYADDVQTTVDNNLSLTGSLTQTFEIGPKLSFMIYGVAGPYIDAKLTEDFNICASSVNAGALNWNADFNLGAKFTLGARAEIANYALFDYSKTWENRELYTVKFPYSIEYHSGNHQQFTNGTPLTNPLKVRVMSNKGFAVPGAVVKFEPFQNNGTVTDTYVITDLNGYAQTSWTPQGVNGVSKLKAIVQNCNQNNILHAPLVFSATENTSFSCTQTTLYASYIINGNIIKPTAHLGVPPYTYSIDNVNFSNTVPQIAMTTGGNYSATVKDSNGCTAVMNYYNGPINCNNSGLTIQTSVYGKNLTVSAQNGNPPYLYALDNGSYSTTTTFTNLALGNHSVKVKDSNNCIRQTSITITNSTNDLVAYFEVPQSIFENETIQLNNLSNNALTYQWNFGDGNFSNEFNPSHSYSNAGIYTITLIASNGSNISTYSLSVNVIETSVTDFDFLATRYVSTDVIRNYSFSNNGLHLYLAINDNIHHHILPTPFDISNLGNPEEVFDLNNNSIIEDVIVNNDGTIMYVQVDMYGNFNNDQLRQYTLSNYSISSPTYVNFISINYKYNKLKIKTDNSKLYISYVDFFSTIIRNIREFNFNIANDITSITQVNSTPLIYQSGQVGGISYDILNNFKSIYVTDNSSIGSIKKFKMSVIGDISTINNNQPHSFQNFNTGERIIKVLDNEERFFTLVSSGGIYKINEYIRNH